MTRKAKQVMFNQYGAPDVLELIETELPDPGPGQVMIRTEAIGVNYSDALRRKNSYFQPTPLPFVPGGEVVGEVIAVGPEVAILPGTRVLAILPSGGGYASLVTAIAQYCIPLPEALDPKVSTAIFIQGSTAQLMVSELAGDLRGKTVLVNAASGGVGSLLVQLLKAEGAVVAAACSSEEKLSIAQQNGATILVNYSRPGWDEQLKDRVDGGVDLVFETVGGDVYDSSVRLLKDGGRMIIYGCAGGVQGTVHPEYFVDRSLSLTSFNLAHFITTRTGAWMEAMQGFMGKLIQGSIRVSTIHSYPLEQVAAVHQMIEDRKTTGKVVLIV
jgi:NADPH2:quinone reductase